MNFHPGLYAKTIYLREMVSLEAFGVCINNNPTLWFLDAQISTMNTIDIGFITAQAKREGFG
jgi:hypothetical protein